MLASQTFGVDPVATGMDALDLKLIDESFGDHIAFECSFGEIDLAKGACFFDNGPILNADEAEGMPACSSHRVLKDIAADGTL